MKTIKRKNKSNIIEALTDAQKFIYGPMAFCAFASAMDLGIINLLDEKLSSEKEIIDSLNLDEYIVRTLLDVLCINKIIEKENEKYNLSKMGKLFLYNDMTKANFNFMKDVCYLGASELTQSFKEQKPIGLYKFFTKKFPTIYPALTSLPEKTLNSWYEFDHFYSGNCFKEIFLTITQKFSSIYDIGGNTGIFETLCLKHNKNINITMLDLKENIEKIKNNNELKNCKFHPINVLNDNPIYPEIKNSGVLMSQFLDCFSKKDIIKILKDVNNAMDSHSSIFILEPFIDMQAFEGAKYSLVHSSLYFTCMANGVSKFYSYDEMKEMIEKAGLKINNCYKDIGPHNYTLLECQKSAVVSN